MRALTLVSVLAGIGACIAGVVALFKLVWAVLMVAVAPFGLLLGTMSEGSIASAFASTILWGVLCVGAAVVSLACGAAAGVGFMARGRSRRHEETYDEVGDEDELDGWDEEHPDDDYRSA